MASPVDIEHPIPDHVRSHPVFGGGTFGIMSAENPRFPAKEQGSHALESRLKQAGLKYDRTAGQYDDHETSYVIHNPSLDQMKTLGHDFGQESVIHSRGGNHELHYTHGPHKDMHVRGHAQQPISYFKHRPDNFWTATPGDEGFFRLNFDPEWKLVPSAPALNKAPSIFGEHDMATKTSLTNLKKALADRLKKAEADFADLGRREAKLAKSEPVDPHQARAESVVAKMAESDKQVLADRNGFSHRWHREMKKSEAGSAESRDYRSSRDYALKKHFAKSYAKAEGHMEPGTHENGAPGEAPHMEPGGHEQLAMPMPDNAPAQPVGSAAGVPSADLMAPAIDQPSPLDPNAGGAADLCPLCNKQDVPGSCTCLQSAAPSPGMLPDPAAPQPLALSDDSGAGMGAAPGGMMMSEKQPGSQPVASPTEMSKADMCKSCGKAHEMNKCGDGLQVKPGAVAKAADFVNVDGKKKTVGVADKAKLPPKGADNAGPGLDGADPKEMSAAGSGGEMKKAALPAVKKPEEKKKLIVSAVTTAPPIAAGGPGAMKAEPPMAKPPSGQNSATAVPAAKPKVPKVGGVSSAPAPMGKAALPAQAKQHGMVDASRAGAAAAVPAPKTAMPAPAAHAARAAGHAAAMGGAFTPKGPVVSGLELAPKKPAGMAAPGAAARKPFGKNEEQKSTLKKSDLGNCLLCGRPEHGDSCQ